MKRKYKNKHNTTTKFIYISLIVLFILTGYLSLRKQRLISNQKSANYGTLNETQATIVPLATSVPTTKPNTTLEIDKIPSQVNKNALPKLNGSNIFALINSYRASVSKPFLNVSNELCSLAEKRADYMIANHREAFKTSGIDNHTGLSEATSGYSGGMVGENLAMNVTSDQGVVNLWKNSSTHNSLMLTTEKDGFVMNKACVATRVVEDGSIIVLLIGDK